MLALVLSVIFAGAALASAVAFLAGVYWLYFRLADVLANLLD